YDTSLPFNGFTYFYRVYALSPNGDSPASAVATGATHLSDSLPAGWSDRDIGAVSAAGWAAFNASTGTFSVSASGTDIWDTADAFHYAYRSVTGDTEIRAQVTNVEATQDWAKAGVMFRESLAAGSKEVFMALTPVEGTVMQCRAVTNGSSLTTNWTAGLK